MMMIDTGGAPAAMAVSATEKLRALGQVALPLDRRGGGVSSNRLTSQIAAEAGTTEHQVRLALYAFRLASGGRTLAQAADAMRRPRKSLQRVARAWLIDFADYRPYARRDPRPDPIGRLT